MSLAILLAIYSPFLAMLPVVVLIYRMSMEEFSLRRSRWTNGLLVLFFWSVFVGTVNEEGLSVLSSLAIFGYAVVLHYMQRKYRKETDIEGLAKTVYWFSIGSAAFTFLEYFGAISPEPRMWKYLLGTVVSDEADYLRYGGTFFNANVAGTWYAVMLLVGYYLMKRSSGWKNKLLYAASGLTFGASLMITQSRAAMLGLGIGMIVYAYYAGHKKKVLLLTAATAAFVVLMLFYPDWFPRGNILYSSIQDRQAIWINSFRLFLMKPLTGWGLFGIYQADPRIFQYIRVFHAHDIPLTFAATLGIAGLLTFFWLQWILYRDIRFLHHRGCRLVPLLAGANAMILGQGLFDFTIMNPQAGLLYIGSAALIEGLAYSYSYAIVRGWKPVPILLRPTLPKKGSQVHLSATHRGK